jgi:hypothetical protein
MIGIILYILFIHFVADFIMQTDEQAKGKSTCNYWLTMHILSYGKTMLFSGVFYVLIMFLYGINLFHLIPLLIGYVTLNMGLHWVTDYFTSRQTKKLWEAKKVHHFFVMIGFDQFIHSVCLIGTYWLLFL